MVCGTAGLRAGAGRSVRSGGNRDARRGTTSTSSLSVASSSELSAFCSVQKPKSSPDFFPLLLPELAQVTTYFAKPSRTDADDRNALASPGRVLSVPTTSNGASISTSSQHCSPWRTRMSPLSTTSFSTTPLVSTLVVTGSLCLHTQRYRSGLAIVTTRVCVFHPRNIF
jgi:hypothetical protein